jgi:hypothetical protein
MKRIALIIAIVLGISFNSFSQWGGGLFQYGEVSDEADYYSSVWFAIDQSNALQLGVDPLMPSLPGHGETDNQNAPLGSGLFLLAGLGTAYAMKKRNSKK